MFFAAPGASSSAGAGFLSDPRRLNVLLTRARRGLVYRPWVERVQACFGRRVARAVATGLAMIESSYNHLFVRPPTSGEVESVR